MTIALRTQQVIAHETGVADTVDPLAGSYYIESLTDQIEKGAADYINRIEELGGMVKAIMAGYPQREIQDAAYKWQKAVDKKEYVVVGVNKFSQDEDPFDDILRIDPALEIDQGKRLAGLKERRDNQKVKEALAALKIAASGADNLVPFILEAVENYGTLGEISDTLREVFGKFDEVVVI